MFAAVAAVARDLSERAKADPTGPEAKLLRESRERREIEQAMKELKHAQQH